MRFLKRSGFNGLYRQHASEKTQPSEQMLRWRYMPKADDAVYFPGKPLFHDGCLNLYRRTELVPVAAACDLIEQLIEQLFPDPSDREHVWNVLAFLVQHPDRKIRHALHIRGPQGTGKNTLFCEILKVLVGPSNLLVGDGSALSGRWIDWLLDKMVVVIDEVQHHGGWEIQNRLKPLITEEWQVAESKGVDFARRSTARLYIVLSNFENHLPLEEGDRRAWVPAYGPPRREPEFYARLHKALPQEIPAFYAKLLARDVSAFLPDAPPPMTEAKAQLIADCRPPLERQLAEMFADGEAPFQYDLVAPRHLTLTLRHAGFGPITDDGVRRAMRRLGWKACTHPVPALPQLGVLWTKDQRVWAVRDVERLSTASKAELKEHLLGQFGTGRTAR